MFEKMIIETFKFSIKGTKTIIPLTRLKPKRLIPKFYNK